MRLIRAAGFAALLLVAAMTGDAKANPAQRFIVYYGADDSAALSGYDTLVFDADNHPPVRPLTAAGKTVLGYISLGEVEKSRSYFQEVEALGILGKKNKNWPDSRFVDVRDPRWASLVTGTLIPKILAQGFSGLFLDTLDDPPDLERHNPKENKGMTAAAAALVKKIHAANPGIPIMLNRAYEILPRVAPDITMELAESMLTDYDFSTRRYRMVSAGDVAEQRSILKSVKADHPRLALYSLDYWWPSDAAKIAEIYKTETAAGFIPYVATVDLMQIVPNP